MPTKKTVHHPSICYTFLMCALSYMIFVVFLTFPQIPPASVQDVPS